jgi:hypothetical protein
VELPFGLIEILIRNDGGSVSAGAAIIFSAGLLRVALARPPGLLRLIEDDDGRELRGVLWRD